MPNEKEIMEKEAEAKKAKRVVLNPEQLASRQLAHDIKVAKFLAGGEKCQT